MGSNNFSFMSILLLIATEMEYKIYCLKNFTNSQQKFDHQRVKLSVATAGLNIVLGN